MWKLTLGYPTSSRFSCNISKEGGRGDHGGGGGSVVFMESVFLWFHLVECL